MDEQMDDDILRELLKSGKPVLKKNMSVVMSGWYKVIITSPFCRYRYNFITI